MVPLCRIRMRRNKKRPETTLDMWSTNLDHCYWTLQSVWHSCPEMMVDFASAGPRIVKRPKSFGKGQRLEGGGRERESAALETCSKNVKRRQGKVIRPVLPWMSCQPAHSFLEWHMHHVRQITC